MSGRREITALTSFRGIAAVLVVLYHFRVQFGPALDWDHYTHLFRLGWLWVDFFFLLSGFVMAYVYGAMFDAEVERDAYWTFILRRLGRVYPLHLFMLLCFIPTEFAKYLVASNAAPAFVNNSPLSILTNVLLVHAWHLHASDTWNYASWSISAEFAAYLVFPFLASWLLRARAGTLVAVGCAGFGLLVVLKATLGHGTLDRTFDWGVLRCLPTFSIGMLLFRFYAAPWWRIKRVVGSDWMLAASGIGVLLMLHLAVNEVVIIAGFALLVLSGSLNSGAVGRFLSARPFHTLGVLSYSIYLTHGLVERVWQFLFDRLFRSAMSTPAACLALLLIMATVVATSALTYRYIETPGRRLINAYADHWRNRSRRRATPAEPMGSHRLPGLRAKAGGLGDVVADEL
jgi:peptidoglycan/LPS O-acetylase OafA/YrhL